MTDSTPVARPHGALNFALDFGPLLIFFLGARFGKSPTDPVQGPIVGTILFMIAMVVALVVSRWKLGRISPMMWVSALVVIGMGALTVWFHDPKFIQIKPTLIYAFFALLLIGGWLRGKALLKYVLEYAYDGLTDTGWLKLSLNWGLFFLCMAGLNEVLRAILSFDAWLTIKVWGMMALTFLFAMANIPMLTKHGLNLGEPAPKD